MKLKLMRDNDNNEDNEDEDDKDQENQMQDRQRNNSVYYNNRNINHKHDLNIYCSKLFIAVNYFSTELTTQIE